MKPATRLLSASAALGAGVLAWSTLVEPRWFALREFSAPVLPPGSDALRVLHLSDLHLVPGQEHKVEWVRQLAALEPDLVVVTGDNLAHQEAVPHVMRAYQQLLDRPGVFVLGSNDYFPPYPKNPLRYFTDSHRSAADVSAERLPTDDLVRGLTRGGWLDLDNARGQLSVRGVALDFVGVDDPHLGYDEYPEATASDSHPSESGPGVNVRIGVTHAPYQRVLDEMAADGASLLIAGHTHGGQICVPGYGALVTNCDLDTGRAKGLSRWWPGAGSAQSSQAPVDAAWLEVSAGLGNSPYAPYRLACRPEATLLTLTSKETHRA